MIHVGDALTVLRALPAESVRCCVTSPPYWGLRDYGVEGQIGLEATPTEYVAKLVDVFREVRRVLRDDGTLWLNLGDSYAGSYGAQGRQGAGAMAGRSVVAARQIASAAKRRSRTGAIPAGSRLKPKDLVGIPWRVAFALQDDGWYLRSDIIWAKPNPMPESVTDRPTKAHEYVFLLSKSEQYFYEADAIAEPATGRESGNGFARPERVSHGPGRAEPWPGASTRNARTVWTIATQPYADAHFATFPQELARRCILAGSRVGDTVLDPFAGSGTTGAEASAHQRDFIGIEINPEYATMAERRIEREGAPLLARGMTP